MLCVQRGFEDHTFYDDCDHDDAPHMYTSYSRIYERFKMEKKIQSNVNSLGNNSVLWWWWWQVWVCGSPMPLVCRSLLLWASAHTYAYSNIARGGIRQHHMNKPMKRSVRQKIPSHVHKRYYHDEVYLYYDVQNNAPMVHQLHCLVVCKY